jgi:hypothetical protein
VRTAGTSAGDVKCLLLHADDSILSASDLDIRA